ncbi:snaclec coagulation factor X-activating enzyme light chain 1-like [Esox lucius]|uniref:snaclec coagulation factor X-activating enzyme light chain 1-like n=1 Tax=Esox lucius TaxID=8010 RepID=UPI000577EE36|nr:snaclec coagulation factor X-activating enzyme light chain 1-like [Esox lucius]XP_028970136.1 snaclec coagulation factor X-activating enzyme light chain 1-like [Esox lucius]
MGVMTVSVFCILIFLVTGGSAIPGQNYCKSGFSQPNPYSQICYLAVSELKSWASAQELCRQKGGKLAFIENNDQLKYAYDMIPSGYFWVDGDHESRFIQENWMKGYQPDGIHTNCLVLGKYSAVKGFRQASCSEKDNTANVLCQADVIY